MDPEDPWSSAVSTAVIREDLSFGKELYSNPMRILRVSPNVVPALAGPGLSMNEITPERDRLKPGQHALASPPAVVLPRGAPSLRLCFKNSLCGGIGFGGIDSGDTRHSGIKLRNKAN